jgi:hypothetical protein
MKTTHFVRDHVMSQAQASQWITGAARHRVGVALRKKKANVGGRADLDRADRLDLSTTALVEVTSEEKDYPKFSA